MPSSSLPISALPEIGKRIDGAERILKADIARMKKLLADRAATLPPSIAEVPLQEAKDSPRPAGGSFTAAHALAEGRDHRG